jgi:hypothetical protein
MSAALERHEDLAETTRIIFSVLSAPRMLAEQIQS